MGSNSNNYRNIDFSVRRTGRTMMEITATSKKGREAMGRKVWFTSYGTEGYDFIVRNESGFYLPVEQDKGDRVT